MIGQQGKRAWRRGGLLACAAVVTASCDLTQVDMPDTVTAPAGSYSFSHAMVASPAMPVAWWDAFNTEAVGALVRTGLSRNAALRAAERRMDSARAEAERLGVRIEPEVAASAEASRPPGAPVTLREATLSVTLALDLRGQRRRDQDRAMLEVLDALAAREDVALELTRAIAQAVVDHYEIRDHIAQTRSDIGRGQRRVEAVETQLAAAAATQLDLLRARASLLDLRARLRALEGQQAVTAQDLVRLVGDVPPPTARLPDLAGPLWIDHPGAVSAIPADLLRSRPDIRRIELEYDAARLRIRDAEAERLPQVFLTGAIDGSQAGTGWRFGPSISLPPLSARVRDAAIEREVAAAQAVLFDWQGAVVTAVSEVETAHARWRASGAQVAELRRAAAEYDRALDIARELFDGGALSLAELLDLEDAASQTRRTLIEARADHLSAFIELNIALGSAPPA